MDYPAADRFAVPVDSFWTHVLETLAVGRRHTIHHPLDGGYGLPVIDKVDGKNLLHLGCDVGFARPRALVDAIAGGVVRV